MSDEVSRKTRLRVVTLSIVAGALILGFKYYAYLLSGSTALLSDAIESVVNVVAAVFALGAVIFAEKPADREHPYGHGKIEHFSAAFEGGLISLAAVMIWWEAVSALHAQLNGTFHLKNLGAGLAVNVVAGLMNGLLGAFLIHMGKKHRSRAIEADGHHVLSDFWTTLGIAAALLLVKFTGILWLDPIMAMVVGTLLAYTGFKLVRSSSQALLDMEDPELLDKLVTVINQVRPVDVIAIHEMRTLRSGRYTHVDIHMVIPEFYPISQGHDLAESFGKDVIAGVSLDGELHTHLDPCQRAWCRQCGVEPCSVRQEPHSEQGPITVESSTGAGSI
ncbi:MAG: cation transporter [Holophaga sp.]|nr:cation transporter [Holophaga sp.]